MDKNIKIFINYILGPAFLLWLSWDVYHQITTEKDIGQQWQALQQILSAKGPIPLILILLLMCFQWMLEAFKWKLLLRDVVSLHWITAFRSILSGITVSVVTPNRLGEFAGRIVHLPNGTRLEGTAYTFMGNLAQLIITCLVGGLALYSGYDQLKIQLNSKDSFYSIDLLLLLSPIVTIALLLLYFSSNWIMRKLGHWKILRVYAGHLLLLAATPRRRLTSVLLLSLLRYGIFIGQYLIVFRFTGVDNPAIVLAIGVAVMLLWLSIVPTFSFMEMGVRWQFALLLFPAIHTMPLAIPVAVTIIWLVNFIVPAFIGALVLPGWRFRLPA